MVLQRSLSLLSLLGASLSAMIGSGWLFGSYYAAQIAGPAATISWLLAGGMIIFIALTFSELSTMLPLSGGIARYTQFSHGTLVSFCMSWLAWLSCVAVAPTEVQALLQYSSHAFPRLIWVDQGIHLLTLPGLSIACLLLFIITWLNAIGLQWVTKTNNTIVLWKLAIPLFTVLVLACTHFEPQHFHQTQSFMPNGWQGVFWALPTAGIIFSFLGFREATSLAGEAKNPQRAIPVAVLGSVLICTLLYEVIQIVFIGAIPSVSIAQGWGSLSFTHQAGPFAGIALTLGLGWLAILIYADAIITPFGTGLIYTATTARLNYAMSKNGYLPKHQARLNRRGAPMPGLMVNFVVGLLLFLPFRGWQALVGFQSVAIVLAYGIGPICLLALRENAPKLPRPFRLPFPRLLCALTFYFCNLMAFWTGWAIIWKLMLCLAVGILGLLAYNHHRRKQNQQLTQFRLDYAASRWLFTYCLGLTVLSYLGSFGGGRNSLTFGWDFVALAIFSLFTLWHAQHSRLAKTATQAALAAQGVTTINPNPDIS